MTDLRRILRFDDPVCCIVSFAGGKGASLATMTQQKLAVPPGFVITSSAFAEAIDEDQLRSACTKGDFEEARAIVSAASLPVQEITDEYQKLNGLVAVRSSACAEDSDGASYAGQQETYLNVGGLPAVLEGVGDCWLSFFTERAVFYRSEKGSMEDVSIAVVVQQMIDSAKSGVLFSVDPVHGRKDRMVVEAAYGLGENVVDGEHTPDNYTLDRKGVIKRKRIVEDQVLSEEETKQLAEIALQLEEIHLGPQDIEWAFDKDGKLFLLQSRPITTI